jgi:hypothetical protein
MRSSATSAYGLKLLDKCGLKLLVYAASSWCMRPQATSVCGLTLLVCAALSYNINTNIPLVYALTLLASWREFVSSCAFVRVRVSNEQCQRIHHSMRSHCLGVCGPQTLVASGRIQTSHRPHTLVAQRPHSLHELAPILTNSRCICTYIYIVCIYV